MKSLLEITEIMDTIPVRWRGRWCGSRLCACMGCVQVGNRIVMYTAVTGKEFLGDPEYIDESQIPPDIYERLKITKEEWELWSQMRARITEGI